MPFYTNFSNNLSTNFPFENFFNILGFKKMRQCQIRLNLTNNCITSDNMVSNFQDFYSLLKEIAVERVSGTLSNLSVRNFIVSQMTQFGWIVESSTFQDNTPLGFKTFSNIICSYPVGVNLANKNQSQNNYCKKSLVLKNRIVFACHYDSKYFENFKFTGATDSAVSCALLLDLAKFLHDNFKMENFSKLKRHIQFIFFDGEEAFKTWSRNDSIYGSRNYANMLKKDYQQEAFDTIDLFILLDLIGADNCQFPNFFPRSTSNCYNLLSRIERHLRNRNMLKKKTQYYFRGNYGLFGIEDDHVPFLNENVPILHLVPFPFPTQWHTAKDTIENLNKSNIHDMRIILKCFLLELFNCEKMNEKF